MTTAIDFDLIFNAAPAQTKQEPHICSRSNRYTFGSKPVKAIQNGQKQWLAPTGELIQGVYLDMPADDYHRIKAVSSSLVKKFAFDPHKAERYWTGKDEFKITPQLKRSFNAGHMFHGLVLEPHVDHGVIAPVDFETLEKSTNSTVLLDHAALKKHIEVHGLRKGKTIAERVEIAKDHKSDLIYYPQYLDDFKRRDEQGERVLDLKDYMKVEDAVKVFKGTNLYKVDYEKGGYSELTIIAFDTERDCYVKARIDRITSDNLMRDLKTIHSMTEANMRNELETRLYFIQGAFYHYCCDLIGFDVVADSFSVTFVEWDDEIRFQNVSVTERTWSASKTYMLEIFDDLVLWLGDKVKKTSLNHSQSLTMQLGYYKLSRRPRVES